jgi:hypothetical protein
MRNIIILLLVVFLAIPLVGVFYQWIMYDVISQLKRNTLVYEAKTERDWILHLLYLPILPVVSVIQMIDKLF